MKGVTEIFTYADLKRALEQMTPDQLSQRIQAIPPGLDLPVALIPVIAIGIVDDLYSGDSEPRECTIDYYDGKHKGDRVVFLTDSSPFAQDKQQDKYRVLSKCLEKIEQNISSSNEQLRRAKEKLEKIEGDY